MDRHGGPSHRLRDIDIPFSLPSNDDPPSPKPWSAPTATEIPNRYLEILARA